MREENKLILFVVIIGTIVLAFVFMIVGLLNYEYPYTCDIGKPDVAGDFTESGWNVNWVSEPINVCAIQDCFAYNQAHNDSECVA